jgi:hypothetical protein
VTNLAELESLPLLMGHLQSNFPIAQKSNYHVLFDQEQIADADRKGHQSDG